MDNLWRGAVDVDVDPLYQTARVEDFAVLSGFAPGGIIGLTDSSNHKSQEAQMEASAFLDVLSGAVS